MALSQIAQTSQGPMIGDYISTSFSGGRAVTMFPVGRGNPSTGAFDEAMYAPTTPLTRGDDGDARGEQRRRRAR